MINDYLAVLKTMQKWGTKVTNQICFVVRASIFSGE